MSTVTKALATDETAMLIKQAIAQIPEAIVVILVKVKYMISNMI